MESLVNHRSRLTNLHDTASLLAAAANRQHQSNGKVNLTSCLLDEVITAFAPEHVHVWESRLNSAPRLIWWRVVAAGTPELAKQAAPGIVKRIAGRYEAAHSESVPRFLTCCEVGKGIEIVLEMALPDGIFDPDQMLELVEILADLHRRDLVSGLFQNAARADELQQILTLLHSDLDAIRVASCLASDTVEFLHCLRISVARRKSRTSWELVAATAVSQPDPRADASRLLCGIIENACETGSIGALSEHELPRRPQMVDAVGLNYPLGDYSIHPLSVSENWTDAEWAVVFEWQTGTDTKQSERDFGEVCKHATLAFQNCDTHSKAGALSMLRRLPQTLRSRRLLTAVGLVTVLLAGMMFVKMDLQIEALGELVPSRRVFVFAPEDGVITDVFVEDGAMVEKEGSLCVLRNEDLELQLESIEGELASTQARLDALDALRGDRTLTQSGMFSVEQAELKERLHSLEAQAVILNRRINRLALNATMAGQIYGDRLQEMLKGRPVLRGQYLFELADPSAGWQIDMRIPEVDVRHVLNRQVNSSDRISISFTVETDPEKKLLTSLSRLSAATEVDEYGRLSVQATAIPGAADIVNPRPGAGIIGYIHCGKQPAGYVLFRRIIESFQRRWWK